MKILKTDKILIAWIIIVLFLVSWPFPDIQEVTPFDYSDKLVHMILFGVFTFLLNKSLLSKGLGLKPSSVAAFIGGSAYAGLAEIIQIVAPGRSCSIFDFYAGAIGSVIALIIIYIIKARQGAGDRNDKKGIIQRDRD
ncbi:MAG: VanZ family protein [Deltaproteobacteria bacterium]|nr:VanZ family protein [Deltaproteobacteria bacterium]